MSPAEIDSIENDRGLRALLLPATNDPRVISRIRDGTPAVEGRTSVKNDI